MENKVTVINTVYEEGPETVYDGRVVYNQRLVKLIIPASISIFL